MNGSSGRRWVWVVVTLGALVAGVALGVVLDRGQRYFSHRGAGSPDARQRFIEHLNTQLNLAPSQRATVDSIFREHSDRIKKLRRDMERGLATGEDSLRASLSRVLSPQQMEKLQQIRRQHRRPRGLFGGFRHDREDTSEGHRPRNGAEPDSR